LDSNETGILNEIQGNDGITIDQIAINCGIPVSKTSALLLNLEFKGLVKCLPGKIYKILN
jgi:DNA processing protein